MSLSKNSLIIPITHFIERYDIGLFVFFSPTIVAECLGGNGNSYPLLSFFLFSVAYLARPLGAVVFGYIGDKFGRKNCFLLSIYLILLSTAAVCFAPTSLGVTSIIIIAIARFFQGLASGTELISALLLISETKKDEKIPSDLVLLRLSATAGLLCAGLIFLLFNTAGYASWRYPFYLGLALNIFNLLIRHKLTESEEFLEAKEGMVFESFFSHLKKVLSQFREIILCLLLSALGPGLFYTTTVYLPEISGISSDLLNAKLLIITYWIVATVMIYFASRTIDSRKIIYVSVSLIASACILQLTGLLSIKPTLYMLIAGGSGIFALSYITYKNLFSVEKRQTGLSIGVSLGQATLGGNAPFLISLIYNIYAAQNAWCIFVLALCTLFAASLYIVENKVLMPTRKSI